MTSSRIGITMSDPAASDIAGIVTAPVKPCTLPPTHSTAYKIAGSSHGSQK